MKSELANPWMWCTFTISAVMFFMVMKLQDQHLDFVERVKSQTRFKIEESVYKCEQINKLEYEK